MSDKWFILIRDAKGNHHCKKEFGFFSTDEQAKQFAEKEYSLPRLAWDSWSDFSRLTYRFKSFEWGYGGITVNVVYVLLYSEYKSLYN